MAKAPRDQITRARDLYQEGVKAFREGNQEHSRRLNRQVLDVGRKTGDNATIVRGLVGLSRVAFRESDHAEVKRLCDEAMPIWEQLEDKAEVTSPIHMLAESARLEGDLRSARKYYEQSLAVSREIGDDRFAALELTNMAFLEIQSGDLDSAEKAALESLSMGSGTDIDQTYSLLALGAVAAFRGDGELAAKLLAASEQSLSKLGAIFDPADKPLFDKAVERTRELLPEGELARLWSEGTSKKTSQLIDEIREKK